MPNWVRNIVHIEGCEDDIAKALELMRNRDSKNENKIDFNNIFPLPERLQIVSGGWDRYYIALYLKSLSDSERHAVENKLWNTPLGFYDNYYKKYRESFMMDIPEEQLTWMKGRFENDYSNIAPTSMEDVGKAYIDNILEYGHDTWYEWCIDKWGTKWNACEPIIGDNYLEFDTAWSAPFPIIVELSRKFPELTFCHEWADEDLGRNCGRIDYRNGEIVAEEDFETNEEAYEFACMIHGYSPDDFEEEE